ncbi:hypothetical protein [Streptomyces sp. NPDC008139]|uniref:hypothetical protein n=1 Tax=Streptomyces sp. NPDC008139 TaxID=3364814 RepID=UPI0036E98EE3
MRRPTAVRPKTLLRYGVGAVGLAAMAFGATLLLTDPHIYGWPAVVEWLVGAVVLHDGVLVPAVLALGALAATRPGLRPRWPFVLAGSLVLIALPVLLRPRPTANPSVLPLDYPRGLAIAVGTVLALALCGAVGRRGWARRRELGRRVRGAGLRLRAAGTAGAAAAGRTARGRRR